MAGNLRAASREVGALWSAQPANPAAGTDWTYTFDVGYIYDLRVVYYNFLGAGGFARLHYLVCWDVGLSVVYRAHNVAVVNNAGQYDFVWLVNYNKSDSTGVFRQQLLPLLYVLGGWTIGTVTTLLQPADQFSNLYLSGSRLRDS